jgi:hypothetical protein
MKLLFHGDWQRQGNAWGGGGRKRYTVKPLPSAKSYDMWNSLDLTS